MDEPQIFILKNIFAPLREVSLIQIWQFGVGHDEIE
jgi:hypothetical protein